MHNDKLEVIGALLFETVSVNAVIGIHNLAPIKSLDELNHRVILNIQSDGILFYLGDKGEFSNRVIYATQFTDPFIFQEIHRLAQPHGKDGRIPDEAVQEITDLIREGLK